jgi:dihydropteroate synthase
MEPKNTFFSRKLTIKCRGEVVDLSIPKVMGVLNLTPDSFYDGGRYDSKEKIFFHAQKMVNEGCDILDIGACSTRPGAEEVTENEEIKRLKPVIELIKLKFPELIISIDTYRSEVARIMVNDYSADIINDISSGDMDEKMLETIASLNVPYIMMHMQGTPRIMQQNPEYKNVVQEVIQYFAEKISKTKLIGISDIIIDPGFGFGKTINHNYQLLKYLSDFRIFELPILVGLSRKSMIYKVLGSSPDDSLNGTTVLNSLALAGGATILRVHDVSEAKETIRLFQKFSNATVDNWHE